MTMNQKQNLIAEIVTLLQAKLAVDTAAETETRKPDNRQDKPVEMLTVKESAAQIKGLSEHTVRQLVAQGKLPSVRAGQGKRGKILISKTALIDYFNQSA